MWPVCSSTLKLVILEFYGVVQVFEFDPCIPNRELPINTFLTMISVSILSGGLIIAVFARFFA